MTSLLMMGCSGWGAAGGGGGGGKALTFHTSAVSGSDLTEYTFEDQAIGDAAAGRRVIVAVGGTQGSRTVSSVTIGGNAATQIVEHQGGTVSTVAFYMALVTTGTAADIVVTWSGAQDRCGIGVWSCTGVDDNVAHDTAASINVEGNSADIDLDVDTLDGGFVIAYGIHHNSGAGGTISWSPAAIEHDFFEVVADTVAHYGGSGETDGTTFDIRTGTVVGSVNGHSPIVAASF